MKIKNILLTITFLMLTLSGVSAEYKNYDNVEDFEADKGAICETASDGCNTFFMTDGKVGGGTKMFCSDHTVERTCTKFKEDTITTMSIETTSVGSDKDEHGCIGSAGYSWSEEKEECVRPWEEEENISICTMEYAPVCGSDGKTYSNTCVAKSNNIENISYDGECVTKKELGENDENFYNVIKNRLDTKYQERVEGVLNKYLKKMENISDIKKARINKKMIEYIEVQISLLLMNYPQDIALPEKVNNVYLILELFKFELMKLDF